MQHQKRREDNGAEIRDKQVAQLWQRNCAKLDTFSDNVQHYSLNHKIAFWATLWGHQGQYKRFI